MDRTHAQLTVYDCPLDQAQAVLDVIEQFGLHPEYDEPDTPADNALALGFSYMDHEMGCGSAQEISRTLQDVAPSASWLVSEDPFESYLGTVCAFTPDLGLWTNDCSAGGDAVFGVDAVLELVDDDLSKVEIQKRLGITHDEALTELLTAVTQREQPTGDYVVLVPPPGERDWRRAVSAGATSLGFAEWIVEQTPDTTDEE